MCHPCAVKSFSSILWNGLNSIDWSTPWSVGHGHAHSLVYFIEWPKISFSSERGGQLPSWSITSLRMIQKHAQVLPLWLPSYGATLDHIKACHPHVGNCDWSQVWGLRHLPLYEITYDTSFPQRCFIKWVNPIPCTLTWVSTWLYYIIYP